MPDATGDTVARHGQHFIGADLISVSNLQQDPLADSLHLSNGASWTRIVQWTEQGSQRFNQPAVLCHQHRLILRHPFLLAGFVVAKYHEA
jgi:hypothetical protein